MITFKNDTDISLYDEFISQYSIRINQSCPTVKDFCIHFITLDQLHDNYSYLKDYSNENFENSPYGCIYDAGFENRVNNVIIINTNFLSEIKLTRDECRACILHEIGHLHYYLEYAETSGNNISLKEFMADLFRQRFWSSK